VLSDDRSKGESVKMTAYHRVWDDERLRARITAPSDIIITIVSGGESAVNGGCRDSYVRRRITRNAREIVSGATTEMLCTRAPAAAITESQRRGERHKTAVPSRYYFVPVSVYRRV
jgi:hypothetical protein